jgi:quinol monooxygenase YgiN
MTHTVLVLIEAKPGKENEVKKILHALVKPSRQEEGCINYDLHDCPDNSGKFMFYENWTSKAAHDTFCKYACHCCKISRHGFITKTTGRIVLGYQ